MAELATIARPYAAALFEACHADLAGAQQWLDALAEVASDADLLRFATNPRASTAQVRELISAAVQRELPAAAQHFLDAVLENRRLSALPEIARQFRQRVNEQRGRSDAVIHSAFPIGDAELKELVAVLEKRFGRTLDAHVEIDPSLIGGVRISVGDEVLDTSVKAHLQQMRAALTA